MATSAIHGLYSDEVFSATELNRRVGTILDRASHGPVTISRNNEMFALVRREFAAKLIRTVESTIAALEIVCDIQRLLTLEGDDHPVRHGWLRIYDKEDLKSLQSELANATAVAIETRDWEAVGDLIYEWEQSAAVAGSGVLDEAMFSESTDEPELASPDFLRALYLKELGSTSAA